jgi:hypothetical protein
MSVAHYTNETAPSTHKQEQHAVPNMCPSDNATRPMSVLPPAQYDGGTDYHPRAAHGTIAAQPYNHHHHHTQIPRRSQNAPSIPAPPPLQSTRATGNAVNDLLPYCTTEPPLSQAQVIALSDVVGSLRELVVLALGAASDVAGCMEKLEGAVGLEAAANVVEFFADEWEIDG